MNPYNRRTTAILPTSTRLDSAKANKNELHSCWGPNPGTYLVLSQKHGYPTKERQIILSGSGKPEGYPEVGAIIDAHHDQTMKELGRWQVIAKSSHSDVTTLKTKSLPLYVYK
jgi:hypothetical protein